MDDTEELILKERVASPVEEGVTIGGGDDDRGDILVMQIPSIDTLLGNIYEFRYQLA